MFCDTPTSMLCEYWHKHNLKLARNQPPPFIDSWVPSTLSLLELPAHLHATLHSDELEHISDVLVIKDITQENYHWASAYSAQNNIHKLAFIIASVLYCMALLYMVITSLLQGTNLPFGQMPTAQHIAHCNQASLSSESISTLEITKLGNFSFLGGCWVSISILHPCTPWIHCRVGGRHPLWDPGQAIALCDYQCTPCH